MSKKMATNMKLIFTTVHFRHNSTCFIQKWLRFKRSSQSDWYISPVPYPEFFLGILVHLLGPGL